ncbi:MAG: 30S ribosomal protein S8 [Armatimonadetes bacterium]|nr:30S ribosomal protein S8 [Armatimonadota bacterium]
MPPTDPIADFLTRLRNASAVGKLEVRTPYAKMLERIATVLAKEAFIERVEHRGRGPRKVLVVYLRYIDGKPAIENLRRVSRPGKRIYASAKDLRPVKSGYGILVLSTPQGLFTNREARKRNVGGEIVCEVW